MRELALNVLDISENSLSAKAKLIQITLDIRFSADTFSITIEDDGCGMSEEMLARVTDPFTTTRTTRKVGMGLPLFRYSAESTGGSFSITSKVRAELGDIPFTEPEVRAFIKDYIQENLVNIYGGRL